MTLAKRLKSAREAKGLGQTELAKLVGITQPSLHQIENGETASPRLLKKIADVLNVDPGWLHYGTIIHPAYEKTPQFTWEQIIDSLKNLKVLTITDSTEYVNLPKPYPNAFALKLRSDIGIIEPSPKALFVPDDIIIIDPDRKPNNNDLIIAMGAEWFQPEILRYIIQGSGKFLSHSFKPERELKKNIKIYGVVIMRLNYLI